MGAYHIVVNLAKKQFLDPGRFGEGVKFRSMLRGEHCIEALKLLITDSCFVRRDGATNPQRPWRLEGSWVGDPIVLASDDSGAPNAAGLRTTTDAQPSRNLSAMAREEFDNISYLAIAMLCAHGAVQTLIERAKSDESFFLDLANVLMQFDLPQLKYEFEREFSQAWPKLYEDIFKRHRWWPPLPLVTAGH